MSQKYKSTSDWNRNQSGGGKKSCAHYDILDRVLGTKASVTMPHVEEAGVASRKSSEPSILAPAAKKRMGLSKRILPASLTASLSSK